MELLLMDTPVKWASMVQRTLTMSLLHTNLYYLAVELSIPLYIYRTNCCTPKCPLYMYIHSTVYTMHHGSHCGWTTNSDGACYWLKNIQFIQRKPSFMNCSYVNHTTVIKSWTQGRHFLFPIYCPLSTHR